MKALFTKQQLEKMREGAPPVPEFGEDFAVVVDRLLENIAHQDRLLENYLQVVFALEDAVVAMHYASTGIGTSQSAKNSLAAALKRSRSALDLAFLGGVVPEKAGGAP